MKQRKHANKYAKKTQLAYNLKIEEGFLPMLAGLIPFLTGTVLPASGLEHYRNW